MHILRFWADLRSKTKKILNLDKAKICKCILISYEYFVNIFDFLLDKVYLAEPSGSENGIRSSKKIKKNTKDDVTPQRGVEPPALSLGRICSIQLSYQGILRLVLQNRKNFNIFKFRFSV